jgi:hypothetical protein
MTRTFFIPSVVIVIASTLASVPSALALGISSPRVERPTLPALQLGPQAEAEAMVMAPWAQPTPLLLADRGIIGTGRAPTDKDKGKDKQDDRIDRPDIDSQPRPPERPSILDIPPGDRTIVPPPVMPPPPPVTPPVMPPPGGPG